MRRLAWILLINILIFGIAASALAMDRNELRTAWSAMTQVRTDASPYLEKPDVDALTAGSLTEEAQADALACLNLLRRIAGLEAVEINPLYTLRAQNGALLLAANDFLDHDAPQAAGMDDEQYASAHLGTSMGNIAKFNWMKNDILIDGVTYFARDDGSTNLSVLGHRRWLLNPQMAETGFGLANARSGMSYVTMYAVDKGNADAQWDYVAWPAAQAFPVELMRSELAWSISLNDEKYDLDASNLTIYMEEKHSGAVFQFDISSGEGDGWCTLSTENCGSGSCIIFRPELAQAGIDEYVQNQLWSVRVDGLVAADGSDAEIAYESEMVSLYPQDVANVELSQLSARLLTGETLKLHADVIPSYADDLQIIWGSSDPNVASVNGEGVVTAIASGTCSVTAMSANGRRDVCEIIVE